MEREASRYEADARDYRSTMTRIIRHHYEEKRKRVLSALEREIGIESKSMREARDEAIRRLEVFVAKYSGAAAHPENTPDSMFRLAALYEERARDVADQTPLEPGKAPPEPDLSTAIALYKRIVREFPKYRELAGAYYYLGHALNDGGRLEEAQQIWRSLVCRNQYPYPVPPDPKDATKDSVARLPQDHDSEWWLGWLTRHPEPLDKMREKPRVARPGRAAPDAPVAVTDDEESYKNPFSEDCRPIPQVAEPGEPPRYLAEIWWRIGDYYFDEIDPQGGPYNYNRAESGYDHSLKFDRPPVYDVSMYKLAWTFFKQQRYETAVHKFVDLLVLTDKREAETGNPGADFRNEAYAYIAGSMTYLDFKGPARNDPYMARNDVFDLYSDPAQVEEAMHVAITRVQDPTLLPQDKRWTVEIYRALAFEFREYNQQHNLIEIDELMLAKWPLHRDAPSVQNQIAQVYEQLASVARGAETERYAAKALEARGKLVNYVTQPGHTPEWVEANKEDPEAVRAAEQLVRGGLRRAAADHTNIARNFIQRARSADDEGERAAAYEQALPEYRLAAKAWGSYLLQDENAEDAYESRFWLADSYTNIVLVKAQLGRIPEPEDVAIAQTTAREVRDSNEDEKYLQPAGIMVVRVAQQVVAANYVQYEKSGGTVGFPERKEVQTEKYDDNGETKDRVVKADVPQPIVDLVAAFDEYAEVVPVEADPYDNHNLFAYQSGEIPFLYGQFDLAKTRLEPIYEQHCGKSRYGYDAWKKLITMANLEGNFEKSHALATAATTRSCALTDADKAIEDALSKGTIETGFYKEAFKAYTAAEEMKEDSPERRKLWAKAAQLYEEALKAAPAHDAAPEAAINGAIAYKQIGNYDKAIGMYELFIKEYGNDAQLEILESGDKAKGKPPNPKKYGERIGYLKTAYDALAESYVLFFDYRRAAQTFDKISSLQRFAENDRRVAAQNAVFLYLSIGDRDKVEATKKRFFGMNPPRDQQAEIEWLIVQGDVKAWDERAPDRSENRTARVRATGTLEAFHAKWANDTAGHGFAVQAAAGAAKMRRAGNEPKAEEWCQKTLSSFDAYKGSAPKDPESGKSKALGSIQADLAAECEYRVVDADLKKNFDYESGHHRYTGVIIDIKKEYKADVEKDAKGYFDKLQSVISRFESPRWAVAARARQGSLYDSCRTGLYNAREPGLKLYSEKEEKILKKTDDLCVNEGNEKACTDYDAFTAKRRTTWREERDNLLAGSDRPMVAGYGEAILWARYSKVGTREVDGAIGRMAFYTDLIGDDKLREYTGILKDPSTREAFSYVDGMYPRMRRGLVVEMPTTVLTPPLPASPQ
ncbi:MAG: tetratricopeptide repeat protein [Myxococcales bacterium]|nr:tetratricopeptide repeat protein [Myxococcales bacterium]